MTVDSEWLDECRRVFESRSTPNLDLKRGKNGDYYYPAARMSFCDFVDGWQAAMTWLGHSSKTDSSLSSLR